MLTVVRLRPYDARKGHKMRSYTSGNGSLYRASGPSETGAFRIVSDSSEIERLKQIEQFEIRTFENQKALDAYINEEAEKRYLKTGVAARTAVLAEEKPRPLDRASEDARKAELTEQAAATAKENEARLTPTMAGEHEAVSDDDEKPKKARRTKKR